MRILLIEDDQMIGTSLVRGLRDAGYATDWVRDGESAATALLDAQSGYALALLDWGLPKRDGLSVLKMLRQRGDSLPVLMITARDGIDDRILGLDKGADDFIVKPFELAELLARMRSALRRYVGRAQNTLIHGELRLDPISHTLNRAGAAIDVTRREFALLRALIERPGAVLSRDQLERQIYAWDDPIESNVIDVLIHSLRRKLGAKMIQNIRGVGWRIAPGGT